MSTRNLGVLLTANSSSLRSQLALASREVQAFGKDVQKAGDGGSRAFKTLGLAAKAGGLVLAAALAYSAKSAADFEANMRNVNSISGLSEQGLKSLSGEVLNLSKALPQSADDLSKGLYDIASSGFQGADGLKVLNASAKAATAGLSDTATSARAITAVLNAYGLGAEHAEDVSDTLFQTVNLGVVSFSELAGVIGDVVGTAAAAGVKIDEVGGAIATMTLSGISAAEAGTSLNRVLQSLIDPSDELAILMSQLGLNMERDLADPAIGLHGVMERLRVATGGNVTALLQLFPEIRAARGAFALMAADGETLKRVYDGIGHATDGAGATQKAFSEQMKATTAQVKIFINGLQAAAIQGGTYLLPLIRDAIQGLRDLGGQAIPVVQAGLAALAPFFRALRDSGADVVTIVKSLVDSLGPAAAALAGLTVLGVIEFLNTLAGLVSSVTGFLAEHAGVTNTVAAAYLLWKGALAINAVLQALGGLVYTLTWRMNAMAGSATAAGASLLTLKGAAVALGGLAVVLGLGAAVTGMQKAKQSADDLYESLVRGLDLSSYQGLRDALDGIGKAQMDIESNTKTQGGFGNAFRGAVELITPMKNSVQDAREEVTRLNKAAEELSRRKVNVYTNLASVAETTGQTRQSVEDLAKALDVDLTQAFDKSGPARQKLVDGFHELAVKALGGGQAVKRAGTESIAALTEMAEKVGEAVKKTQDAFSKSTDFVTGFTADIAKNSGLKKYLEDTTKMAETFATNLQKAASQGLDPKIIERLLQAGPEAAAPLLEAIVNDHSGRLVELANGTEKALGQISAKVTAFARLTAQAINDDKSDQKVRDLGRAMEITGLQFDSAGSLSKQAIADKMGVPLEEVDRIAKEFGITIGALAEPIKAAANPTDAFAGALRNLNTELQNNGPYIGEYTEGGKRNKKAVDDVVASIKDHMAKLNEQGATMDEKRAAFNRHVEDLRSVLAAAGLSKAEIDKLVGALKEMEGTYTAKVDVNTSAANASLDQLQGRLNELNAEIAADGPGGGPGGGRRAEANAIQGRIDAGETGGPSATDGATAGGSPAEGNYHSEDQHEGSVLRFYANGGRENHVAQIAPKGTTRVWNEDETDGEAYIPYALSKRGRSTQILAQVAGDFGMGLVAMARGGAPSPMPTFSGGGGDPARAISEAVARAVREAIRAEGGGRDIDYDRLAQAVTGKPVKAYVVVSEMAKGLQDAGRRSRRG